MDRYDLIRSQQQTTGQPRQSVIMPINDAPIAPALPTQAPGSPLQRGAVPPPLALQPPPVAASAPVAPPPAPPGPPAPRDPHYLP
jgi:hypothetical protein